VRRPVEPGLSTFDLVPMCIFLLIFVFSGLSTFFVTLECLCDHDCS